MQCQSRWPTDGPALAYPSPGLQRIQAYVMAINSADEERNPPQLGVMESEMARIPHARLLLVAGSAPAAGHCSTAQAKWWKEDFRTWLQGVPKQARQVCSRQHPALHADDQSPISSRI